MEGGENIHSEIKTKEEYDKESENSSMFALVHTEIIDMAGTPFHFISNCLFTFILQFYSLIPFTKQPGFLGNNEICSYEELNEINIYLTFSVALNYSVLTNCT